jgi:hypothetical protein
MDGAALFWLLVLGLGAGLFILIRSRQERVDAARRQQVSEAYDQRKRDQAKDDLLAEIDRYFPFLREAFRAKVEEGTTPEDAFAESLYAIPSVELGTTFYDLPALLPLDERRKHLYVVGKTGSGKTSLLLHLIKSDLEEGRGVGVIAPEAELFRDWLLPLVPEERAEEVIYFAPGNPKNPVTFNPLAVENGDDRGRASEDLFAIFKRAVGEDEFGARMSPILASAFACLTGRPGATLWDVKRLLDDPGYRKEIAESVLDDYLREFWLKTYPSYPKGSHLPIVNRLDQFLRPIPVRRALCHPESSFLIRRALAEGQILLFDLSGLAPDSMLLLGQMLLAKFQLELMRRESIPQGARRPFYLYADEFQAFSGVAEGTWRELLSRGRRYGLALTLAHQYPSQLPQGLQDEIFGNVASIVAFGLSAKDAQAVRKEFLEEPLDRLTLKPAQPVPLERFVALRPGQAMARLGGGAFALPLQTLAPLREPPVAHGETIRRISWETYGAPPSAGPQAGLSAGGARGAPKDQADFLE